MQNNLLWATKHINLVMSPQTSRFIIKRESRNFLALPFLMWIYGDWVFGFQLLYLIWMVIQYTSALVCIVWCKNCSLMLVKRTLGDWSNECQAIGQTNVGRQVKRTFDYQKIAFLQGKTHIKIQCLRCLGKSKSGMIIK